MKRLAGTIAILGFFVLTGVGLLSGVPVFDCAMRGLGGAVALYVVVRVAVKLFVNVVAETIADSAPRGGVEDDLQ